MWSAARTPWFCRVHLLEHREKERARVGGAPGVQTERMIAQQTVFTVCANVLEAHGPLIEQSIPDMPDELLHAKLVIPAALKTLGGHFKSGHRWTPENRP